MLLSKTMNIEKIFIRSALGSEALTDVLEFIDQILLKSGKQGVDFLRAFNDMGFTEMLISPRDQIEVGGFLPHTARMIKNGGTVL